VVGRVMVLRLHVNGQRQQEQRRQQPRDAGDCEAHGDRLRAGCSGKERSGFHGFRVG
jgi:hypothetical protein